MCAAWEVDGVTEKVMIGVSACAARTLSRDPFVESPAPSASKTATTLITTRRRSRQAEDSRRAIVISRSLFAFNPAHAAAPVFLSYWV